MAQWWECSPPTNVARPNPGLHAICRLSLLLVLSFVPRGFSPGTPVFPPPQKPTLPNSNLIWNSRTRLNEFIWTLKCFVGKKAIYIFFKRIKSFPLQGIDVYPSWLSTLSWTKQYLGAASESVRSFLQRSCSSICGSGSFRQAGIVWSQICCVGLPLFCLSELMSFKCDVFSQENLHLVMYILSGVT